MQVNIKELTCILCVNHLELVLMNVLVLQSVLAVSTHSIIVLCQIPGLVS